MHGKNSRTPEMGLEQQWQRLYCLAKTLWNCEDHLQRENRDTVARSYGHNFRKMCVPQKYSSSQEMLIAECIRHKLAYLVIFITILHITNGKTSDAVTRIIPCPQPEWIKLENLHRVFSSCIITYCCYISGAKIHFSGFLCTKYSRAASLKYSCLLVTRI